MTIRRKFVVYLEVPEAVNMHTAALYIKDAVESMGGALRPPKGYGSDDPGDPMFGSHTCKVDYIVKGERWTTDAD